MCIHRDKSGAKAADQAVTNISLNGDKSRATLQHGTPLMVLKELGGWETIAMVQKYAPLAPSRLAQHAGTVTFWAQSVEQKEKTPLSEAAQILAA
ncbi:prophage DLP12 integrase domain protein [Burkholderia pseudomallei MSHR5596]|nr:prophage DLP12 integrase domain protein [Burkholderia pseudomallei MSHR5596]